MSPRSLPAVYMRGGTSRALFFHERDLPASRAAWDPVFLAAIGSPDPNGRQLDGMGGGISSLSKVAVIGPPGREDADVDYTFAQVQVAEPLVGYRGNCGNISSAVGPFALEEGLVRADGETATVRIHNTNTRKIIVARFPLQDGRLAPTGDFALQGVAGTAAPIRLSFLDPGGAATGRLLPTGSARDRLVVEGIGPLEVSMVDAANPVIFVAAEALGLAGIEPPEALAADRTRLAQFEAIRAAAAVAMGLVATVEEARTKVKNVPQILLIAPPRAAVSASGTTLHAAEMDVLVRAISAGQPHKATPLTGAMCLAVAAQIAGSLPHALTQRSGADLRIAHPSGILPVAARTHETPEGIVADEAVVVRTARRLMEGRVLLRP